MSDMDTFGPRLRAERERRGISLDTIASVTKVGAELWDGLERNDFSRWPSGIFARAFIRDYARAQIAALPDAVRRLRDPAGYEVRYSERLRSAQRALEAQTYAAEVAHPSG